MISKALALIGQKQGLQVKQSEVHGMAKRGGVVFSHVRFGEEVWSPTIAKGEADALIALEWAEGLRWIEYLRPEAGVFIADTRRIVPPFACRSRRHGATMAYARETPAEALDKVGEGFALDASAIASGLGEPRAANTVLLGVLSTSMDISVADWLAVLETLTPQKSRAINLRGVRGRPRLGGSGAKRPVAAVRRRLRRTRPARGPAGRVGQARHQRRVVQGLRHLRETLPRTLLGAERPSGRVSARCRRLHRLPRLRMALPRLRHRRPHDVHEPVTA